MSNCTVIEHEIPIVITSDDCNAEPIVINAVESTTVLVESAPEVIEINAGPRGLPGPKGDKGDKGDDGDVPEAPLDGAAYARQSGSWVQALAASARGAAGGVASLDATGKLPESQIPAVAITDVYTVSDQPGMLALDAQRGDIAVRADVNKSFALQTEPATLLANWVELRSPTDAVLSVAGKTGAVALVLADIDGLVSALDGKQSTLISGTNIKTVGGQSLLGSGDVPAGGASPTHGPSAVTLTRAAGVLTSVSFTLDGKSGTTTLTRAAGVLTSVVTAYDGKTRTETLGYTAGVLTSVTATEV